MEVTGALSVRAAAAEAPARPALVVDGAVRTWAELAADVELAMPALAPMVARASGSGDAIGLIGDRRYPTLVAVYAAIELGLPFALAHPRWTPAERARWCRLVPGTFFEVPATSQKSPFGDIPTVFQEVPGTFDGENVPGTCENVPGTFEKSSFEEILDPEKILAVLPTSGTTGRPKGVALGRRAFLAAAAASAENLGWRDEDRWLLALPLAHVGGLSILVRCLTARRAMVIETAERFVPERFAATIERRRVTIVSLVPTMLRRLVDLEPSRRPPLQGPPRCLRAALVGGAGAAPELLADARARGWPVLATYGLTEACSQVATQRLDAGDTPAAGCGPPVAGVEVRIRDGAIEVRGPTLLSGYVTARDTPLDSALDSPLDPDGWLRTGDRGFLDEAGHLHVLGRADDAISSGGELVDPLEVERALEAHPAIAAACVFARADPVWGQAVAAALVAREPPDDGALIAHCRARLAGFKRPRAIAYLDDLPATPGGKVDRAAVAAMAGPALRALR